MTPTDVMRRYFQFWNDRDFDAFEAQLAAGISFSGPLATVDGPAACRAGIEGMSRMMDHVDVLAMAADGPDVITWFELHVPGLEPVAGANWAQVRDDRIHRVRVTFDPRPLLAGA